MIKTLHFYYIFRKTKLLIFKRMRKKGLPKIHKIATHSNHMKSILGNLSVKVGNKEIYGYHN